MFSKIKTTILVAISSISVMVIGIVVIYVFKDIFAKIGTSEVAYFWTPNSLPMLFLSISIFEIFKKIKLNHNKVINTIASTTLGIYLLHDGLLAKYMWNDIFMTLECLNSKYYLLCILISTIIIFIGGAMIDLMRQLVEKITVDKFLNSNLYQKIKLKCRKLVNKILKFV